MRHLLLALLVSLAFLPGCDDSATAPAAACDGSTAIEPEAAPCPTLSGYGLFNGRDERGWPVPAEGTFIYTLNTSLFSDDTLKLRTIRLPEGAGPMVYRDPGPFDFPVGTVITKTFAVGEDLRDSDTPVRILETRLLIRREREWFAAPYIWDADQQEARHRSIGQTNIAFSWVDAEGNARSTQDYAVPARTECGQCHREERLLDVIGPKARHLNRPSRYIPDGMTQLEYWADQGWLTGLPSDPNAIPRTPVAHDPDDASLDERARGWLDVQCAHCHNDTSEVAASGLDLRPGIVDLGKLGVCKSPSAAGADGSGGLRYDIVPGHPERSILVYRLEADASNTLAIMPRLGRSVVDQPGLALMREWVTWLGTQEAEARYPGVTSASCIP